jgi:4-azaleucine resistance transporter AzlC
MRPADDPAEEPADESAERPAAEPDVGSGQPEPQEEVNRPSPLSGAVTLALAVGVFGVSFGVLATASGLSVYQACAMSLLVFTGASQFAAIGIIDGGGSPAAALGSALLLAARNTAYGIAVAPLLRGPLRQRLVAAHLVVDEPAGLALAEEGPARQRQAFWFAGVALFVCWNVGTLVGSLSGQAIGDPETFGLDAAFPAGFVALLAPHLRSLDGKLAALLGATIALVLVPFVPVGLPILAASLAALVGLRPGARP